jgi:hypothetical protein
MRSFVQSSPPGPASATLLAAQTVRTRSRRHHDLHPERGPGGLLRPVHVIRHDNRIWSDTQNVLLEKKHGGGNSPRARWTSMAPSGRSSPRQRPYQGRQGALGTCPEGHLRRQGLTADTGRRPEHMEGATRSGRGHQAPHSRKPQRSSGRKAACRAKLSTRLPTDRGSSSDRF